MTVCIAAICDGGDTIVAAMDRMVSFGFTSSDVGLKAFRVKGEWFALYAGDDLSPVLPILGSVRRELVDQELSLEKVKSAFVQAYQGERRQKAEDEILSQYGLTIESFVRDGLQSFGDVGFNELRGRIESIDLKCAFLVAGFDSRNRAHIFAVSNPGSATSQPIAFWAIGSGDVSALSSLAFHQYMGSSELHLCIYHVCEAKFMAEKALGVGPSTFLFGWKSDGNFFHMTPEHLDRVRELWESSGRPKLPNNTATVIQHSGFKQLPQSKTKGE